MNNWDEGVAQAICPAYLVLANIQYIQVPLPQTSTYFSSSKSGSTYLGEFMPPSLWRRSCQRLNYIRRQRSWEAAPAYIEYSPVPNMQSHTYLQQVQNHVMDTLISGWATYGRLMATACIKLKRNIKTNNCSYSLDI